MKEERGVEGEVWGWCICGGAEWCNFRWGGQEAGSEKVTPDEDEFDVRT